MKTEQFTDFSLTYDDSPEAKERAWQALLAFYKSQESFAGECIMQRDQPQIDGLTLLCDIADDIFQFEQAYHQ